MNTQKHTPGPWTYYGDDMVAKNGELIAQVLRGGKRQLPIQSNRALIAAAPDLLAALENVELRVTQATLAADIVPQKKRADFLLGELSRIKDQAHQAIAKALGKSS